MSGLQAPFGFIDVCKNALESVQIAQARLTQMCPCYVAGALPSYEPVSRAAYLFGFEVKTLAETLDWHMLSTPAHVQYLGDCSQTILDRAKEFEQLLKEGALSRAHVYFDDVLQPDDLTEALILSMREDAPMPQQSANLSGGANVS